MFSFSFGLQRFVPLQSGPLKDQNDALVSSNLRTSDKNVLYYRSRCLGMFPLKIINVLERAKVEPEHKAE